MQVRTSKRMTTTEHDYKSYKSLYSFWTRVRKQGVAVGTEFYDYIRMSDWNKRQRVPCALEHPAVDSHVSEVDKYIKITWKEKFFSCLLH